mgnify:CR=1 FL=1
MGPQQDYTVLVIGEREDTLDTVVKGLTSGRINTCIVSEVNEAVSALESNSVDLFLLYRPTEQLKQYGILARLRELKTTKSIPVVVVVDPESEVLVRGAGDVLSIEHYVHAPPDIVQLQALMNQICYVVKRVIVWQ